MYLKKYTNLNQQENRQHQYKEMFKKDNSKWDDSMVLLTKWFKKYSAKNALVLDIGCGNGNWVIDELKENFSNKIGLDVNKKNTKKNISLDKIYYGGIEHTKFKDKEFDCTVSLWTLEHLSNPKASFIEINRILKNGGVFGFCTPNKNFFLLKLKNLIPQKLNNYILKVVYGRNEKDVFKTFYKANTKRQINDICEKTGFKILELKENFDPSYTSFNNTTYKISKFLYKLRLSIFNAHIVGIIKKI